MAHEKSNDDSIKNKNRETRIANISQFSNDFEQKSKIKIDQRFSGIFTDKDFDRNLLKDPHSGKILVSKQKDISDLYYIDDNEDNDENIQFNSENMTDSQSFSNQSDDVVSSDFDDDYILGEKWNILDKNIERQDITTSRLSLCNMSWSNINSDDIFILILSIIQSIESVKSQNNSDNGHNPLLKSVKIYKSDFGVKCLEHESKFGLNGIEQFFEINDDYHKSSNDVDQEQFNRLYELNKLKYFYAIIELNDPDLAKKIYNEIDGSEFLKSGLPIDLRFVPDDIEFDEDRIVSSSFGVDLEEFQPSKFVLDALTSTKLKDNSWDKSENNEKINILTKMNKTLNYSNEENISKVLEVNHHKNSIIDNDILQDDNEMKQNTNKSSFDIEFEWDDEINEQSISREIETNDKNEKLNSLDIDLTDKRFDSILKDSDFIVDSSAKQYRKSKANIAIQNRRLKMKKNHNSTKKLKLRKV